MIRQIKAHLKHYPLVFGLLKSAKSYLLSHAFLRRGHDRARGFFQEMVDLYESAFVTASFGRRVVPVPTPLGFKLATGRAVGNQAMQAGTFEPEETDLIRSHLHDADVFVDIGANIGLYTCLAKLEGKHAIAFEPQPKNLTILYANLIENSYRDVEVYPIALSDRPHLATLYGASGTGASLVEGRDHELLQTRSTVPSSTLDILLGERFLGKKLVIKMDVEGGEYGILRGAERVLGLSPRPTWIVEILLNEYGLPKVNPYYVHTFEMFWQHGYEARTADRSNRSILPNDVSNWVRQGRCESGTINYLFTEKQ
jgi:FkbM family methyltransferase